MKPRRALLLIDFQHDFLAAEGRMPIARDHLDPLIANTNRAIAAARADGTAVIAIVNAFPPSDRLMNLLRRHAALAGSAGAAWDPRIDAAGAPTFSKTRGDAFSNASLGRYLAERGTQEVILAGLMAGACVAATARGAVSAGLRVRILEDAVADRSDEAKAAALRRLARVPGVRIESGLATASKGPAQNGRPGETEFLPAKR